MNQNLKYFLIAVAIVFIPLLILFCLQIDSKTCDYCGAKFMHEGNNVYEYVICNDCADRFYDPAHDIFGNKYDKYRSEWVYGQIREKKMAEEWK